MIRYQITDRKQYGSLSEMLQAISRSAADWIQVREKDLKDRELAQLTRAVVSVAPAASKVLVNGRVDIALACGAHGVHLPSESLPPEAFRKIVPDGFLIGVSCHSLADVRRAEAEGADFCVFGPVFPPLSKSGSLPAVGLEGLAAACRAVDLRILALGGVTFANAPDCVAAGAAGIAGITLFRFPVDTSLGENV